MAHTGQCCCGQLRIHYAGDITRTSVCHCIECQRRTGAVFGTQTRLDPAKVTIEGTATVYERTGDAGGHIKMRFCPTCGSTVYWEIDKLPGAIIVGTGIFADRTLPAPSYSVYEDRMHAWVVVPEDAEHIG